MPSLEEFVQKVLPQDNWVAGVAINPITEEITHEWYGPGEPRHKFLAQWLNTKSRAGFNCYISCGSFSQRTRRGEFSAGVRAFWLDVDAGPGKPYPDAETAAGAVDQFAVLLGLPRPTIVWTGNGVHAWWIINRVLERAEWFRVAVRLKELCREHKLSTDPSRTADIASILRVPDTYNYKDPENPKEVQCDEIEPEVDADRFIVAVLGRVAHGSHQQSDLFGSDVGAKIAKIYDNNPTSSPEGIAGACQQVRAFRDAKGNVSEPLWYAHLGLLAHCVDGLEFAQAWSSGHPEYSEAATDAKFRQAREAAGPTTCQRLRELNPEGCKGCPHHITSPIVLGRPGYVAPPYVEVDEEKLPLPPHFSVTRQGTLIHHTVSKEGEAQETIISPFPIYVSALRRSITGKGFTVEFSKKEPHRDWHKFEVPAELLRGPSAMAEMARNGFFPRLASARSFGLFLEASIEHMKSLGDEGIQHEQYGWKDDMEAFLVGDTLFKSDGKVLKCPGMNEAGNRAFMFTPAPKGSLEKWSVLANTFFAPGFEAQGFSLLMPFAAPLMKFITHGQEGGAIYSMSCGSGKGKSTILSAMASVYGTLQALQIKNSDTKVAKERVVLTACNLPVIYDEWKPTSVQITQDFVSDFTIGLGKSRGTKSGVVTQAPEGWETILIFASNYSLMEHLSGTPSSEPMANRVFELDVVLPENITGDEGRSLSGDLHANRGWAGYKYLSYIVQPKVKEYINAAIAQAVHNYTKLLGASPADRYNVYIMACCAVAATLVNKMGILTFNTEALMKWALSKGTEAKVSRQEFHQDEVATLMRFIRENSDACVYASGPHNGFSACTIYQEPRKAVMMRNELHSHRLYVSNQAVRTWCGKTGASYISTVAMLEKLHIVLNRHRLTQLTAGSNLPPVKTPCWEIDTTHPMVGEATVRLVQEQKAVIKTIADTK